MRGGSFSPIVLHTNLQQTLGYFWKYKGNSNLLLAAKLYSALTDLEKSNRPSLQQASSAKEIAIASILLSYCVDHAHRG